MHDIAKEWMMYCQQNIKSNCNTFETLIDTIDSIRITAISWCNIMDCKNPDFLIITANGTLVFFEITGTDSDLQMRYQQQIDAKQVNALEWFSFYDKNKCRHSYVVTCERNGIVRLLAIKSNKKSGDIVDVIEKQRLFNETDGVFANGIQWEYCNQTNRLVVVYCKAMHVFVNLISVEGGSVLSTCIQYIENLTINGKEISVFFALKQSK